MALAIWVATLALPALQLSFFDGGAEASAHATDATQAVDLCRPDEGGAACAVRLNLRVLAVVTGCLLVLGVHGAVRRFSRSDRERFGLFVGTGLSALLVRLWLHTDVSGVIPWLLAFGVGWTLAAAASEEGVWRALGLAMRDAALTPAVLIVLAGIVWCLALANDSAPGLVSFRTYSVWGWLVTGVTVLAVTSMFDAVRMWLLRHASREALRHVTWVLAAGVPVVVLVAVARGLLYADPLDLSLRESTERDGASVDAWLTAVEQRLDRPRTRAGEVAATTEVGDEQLGPVVLVAAAGGGSRAAAWTVLALRDLATTSAVPGHATWCGDSCPTLLDNTLVVSGVSGGAVGAAIALADEDFAKPLPGDAGDAEVASLERSLSGPPSGEESLPAGRAWSNFDEVLLRSLLGKEGKWDRYLADPVLDRVLANHQGVGLQGVLRFGTSRGAALANFWADERGAGGHDAGTDAWWSSPDRPHVLANTTLAHDGADLVLGFPRTPAAVLGGQDFVLSLDALAPGSRIRMADAMRMASAFPFALDAPRLHLGEVDGHERYEMVTDGGVLDNTGLMGLTAWVDGLQRLALQGDDVGERAKAVLSAMAKRGVLVVEVAGGGITTRGPTTWVERLAHAAVGSAAAPVQGFLAAAVVDDSVSRAAMLNHLSKNVGYGIGPMLETFPNVSRVRTAMIAPNLDVPSVVTAWGLGTPDVARVLRSYEDQRDESRERLRGLVADLDWEWHVLVGTDVPDGWATWSESEAGGCAGGRGETSAWTIDSIQRVSQHVSMPARRLIAGVTCLGERDDLPAEAGWFPVAFVPATREPEPAEGGSRSDATPIALWVVGEEDLVRADLASCGEKPRVAQVRPLLPLPLFPGTEAFPGIGTTPTTVLAPQTTATLPVDRCQVVPDGCGRLLMYHYNPDAGL